MSDVWLANTPFHLSIALGMAAQSESTNPVFILQRDWEIPPDTAAAVESALGRTATVLEIEGTRGATNAVDRWRAYRRSLGTLRRATLSPSRLYWANDSTPVAQWLLSRGEASGSSAIRFEDGVGDYVPHRLPNHGPAKALGGRVVFGRWYRSVERLGDYMVPTDYVLHLPDLAVDDHLSRRRHHPSPLLEPAVDRFWQQALPEAHACLMETRGLIVAPPHAARAQLDGAARALAGVLGHDDWVWKPHPRDHEAAAPTERLLGQVPAELLLHHPQPEDVGYLQIGPSTGPVFLGLLGRSRVMQADLRNWPVSAPYRRVLDACGVAIVSVAGPGIEPGR